MGKTRAIKALTVLLEWQYPGLPVHWVFCEDHEQTTERTFFEDALRHITPNNGRAMEGCPTRRISCRRRRAGWRLADIAQDLWECFDLSRRPDRRGTRLELPMFHLCRVVELLLLTSRGGPEGVISRTEMSVAVEQSNFATAEGFGG